MHVQHGVEPHDSRAIHAKELRRVEPLLERADRRADSERGLAAEDAHVVAFGLDAVDAVGRKEHGAAVLDDEQPRKKRAWNPIGCDPGARTRGQPIADAVAGALASAFAGPVENALESRGRVRLEEVVHRAHIERAERVLLVGGDEDDVRRLVGPDGVEDAEAIQARHPDVQEHDVRREALDHRDGFAPGGGLTYDLDIARRGE